MNQFFVEIRKYEKDEVIKRMGPYPERLADKIDSGANRNLNHEEYYTMIVESQSLLNSGLVLLKKNMDIRAER